MDNLLNAIKELQEVAHKASVSLYNFERSFKDTVDNETPSQTAERVGLLKGEIND